MKYVVALLALFSLCSAAQEISLGEVKTFPVAKQLVYEDGEPATVINTPSITGDDGSPARGPHTINFTLAADAAYAVVIDGERVEPGETYSFVQNLTTMGHMVSVPIYPADTGIEGAINYTMEIPDVKTMVCLPGQEEVEDGCVTTTYEVLLINCPDTYTSNTDDGIQCVNYTTAPITLYCEDGYTKDSGDCVKETLSDADYSCDAYEGTTLNGTNCVLDETFDVSNCPDGYDVYNSQCRKLTGSTSATAYCSKGTNTGSGCLGYFYNSANGICPTGQTDYNGACYNSVSPVCPSGYTYQPYAAVCYLDSDTEVPYTWVNYSCPTGSWNYAGDRCLSDSHSAYSSYQCSSGTYDSSTGKCKVEKTYSYSYTCPSGYSRSGTTCYAYSYKSAGNFCLQGGEYDSASGTCVNYVYEPAGRHCEDPSVMEPDGETCKLIEEYLFKNCDDETFVPADDYSKCERTLVEEPDSFECPDEFEVDEENVQCVNVEKKPFI